MASVNSSSLSDPARYGDRRPGEALRRRFMNGLSQCGPGSTLIELVLVERLGPDNGYTRTVTPCNGCLTDVLWFTNSSSNWSPANASQTGLQYIEDLGHGGSRI